MFSEGMTKPDGREPLVSVVVPVFNGEEYLAESLESILGQTYDNLEVVVMDDASTDRAPEILRLYAERDPRVRYERQTKNRGIFGNINDGIALARGDYVAIHHSDDVYDREILAVEVAYLDRHPDIGAVFCTDIFIDRSGTEFGRLELPPEIRAAEVLSYADVLNAILRHQNVFIRGGTSLIRRAVYDEVGRFDDRYALRADLDMWLRISRRFPIAILDRPLVRYRTHAENASVRYARFRTEPELWFSVVDRALAEGGMDDARPDALAAYEGHRAHDLVIVAVNQYILGDRTGMRATLERVKPRRIVGTRRIRRWRLLFLWASVQLLARLPRLDVAARAFSRRLHRAGETA
ncbi:MAG: hypothetical protein HW413_977 [Thermoleophilia bacterium]|nr:hypothetical protein [Thermoleophilia bacterium]